MKACRLLSCSQRLSNTLHYFNSTPFHLRENLLPAERIKDQRLQAQLVTIQKLAGGETLLVPAL